jgi:hypothetical protein
LQHFRHDWSASLSSETVGGVSFPAQAYLGPGLGSSLGRRAERTLGTRILSSSQTRVC